MKQLPKQKWILSTLLIAALGSQYYFSTSSKNIGAIDLASQATGVEPSIIEMAGIIAKLNPSPQTSTAADKSPAALNAAKQKAEAASPAIPCSDCVTLTKDEAAKLSQILGAAQVRQILDAVDGGKKSHAKSDIEIAETPAEKLRREREEREELRKEAKQVKEEKKREALLAKAEAEKEKQEIRNEKFKDDFERLTARCSDVDCYSSNLSMALSRYTSRNNRISSTVVSSIFNEHIAKDLKEGLKDPTNEKALSALETLMADIPAEYKALKNKSIDLAKSITAPKAVEANAKFKQAEQLRKANKLNESSQVFTQAMEQKTELEAMLGKQYDAVKSGTERGDDNSTFNYYNMNYAKPASKWLADIMNSSNFTTGVTDATGTVNTNQSTQNSNSGRGVVRGGGTVMNNSSNGKITTPGNNTIHFGTQQQGSRGGRNSY